MAVCGPIGHTKKRFVVINWQNNSTLKKMNEYPLKRAPIIPPGVSVISHCEQFQNLWLMTSQVVTVHL